MWPKKVKRKKMGYGILTQQLQRAPVSKCTHGLPIAPIQMLPELLIQVIQTVKLFPVIEIPLVVPMTAFHLAIVPGCSGRDQNMLNTRLFKHNIKWAFLRFADVFVGELCTIIGLDPLDRERKCFLKHPEEFHSIFRCMLLKRIYKSYTGTLINCGPKSVLFYLQVSGQQHLLFSQDKGEVSGRKSSFHALFLQTNSLSYIGSFKKTEGELAQHIQIEWRIVFPRMRGILAKDHI